MCLCVKKKFQFDHVIIYSLLTYFLFTTNKFFYYFDL